MSKINEKNAPFRADVVGSFLRPVYLTKARAKFKNGEISKEELKSVEDKAITELIEKQKKAGLKVITDGEFRRSWWHLDFMWGLNGVDKTSADEGYRFHDEVTRAESAFVTGKISGENHPFVEHFKFVKQFEDDTVVARQTIPAPAQLFAEIIRGYNAKSVKKFYPRNDELVNDIGKAYQTVIKDLYNAGCRNIQFDDCTWGLFCDKGFLKKARITEEQVRKLSEQYIEINNLALDNKPEDLVINTHVCRGNYHSTWAFQGGYDLIAPYLFEKENVSAYYLEYDSERSGSFEPLKYVSGNKKVVLGLVTTKSPALEDKEVLIKRVHEAEKYIPLDRLCISPQCGFASTEEGNKLTEEEQWAKIKLVQDVAEEIWK